MKPLVLEPTQWKDLQQRLKQDYPLSVMLLRSKRREVLGFTERYHRQWMPPKDGVTGYYREQVHLDFFDDAKRTFFTLKYGEFLEKG